MSSHRPHSQFGLLLTFSTSTARLPQITNHFTFSRRFLSPRLFLIVTVLRLSWFEMTWIALSTGQAFCGMSLRWDLSGVLLAVSQAWCVLWRKSTEVKYNPHYIMSRVRTISLTVFITVDVNLIHLIWGIACQVFPLYSYSFISLLLCTVLEESCSLCVVHTTHKGN